MRPAWAFFVFIVDVSAIGGVGNIPHFGADPDGEFVQFIPLLIWTGYMYYIRSKIDEPFIPMDIVLLGVSTVTVGGIFGPVGGALGKAPVLNELGRATAHGLNAYGRAFSKGGGDISDFITGFVSSGFGSLGDATGFSSTWLGNVAIGAIGGGITEEIQGGDFLDGFITGGVISGLNHGLHKLNDPLEQENTAAITEENRKKVVIVIKRKHQTNDATVSEFDVYVDGEKKESGFWLEPGGPSTTTALQDKRIPKGVYNIASYSSTGHPNTYIIWNQEVSKSRRILIHIGNYHSDTEGCSLPGSSVFYPGSAKATKIYNIDTIYTPSDTIVTADTIFNGENLAVGNSGNKFQAIKNILDANGGNAKIIFLDMFF